MQTDLVWNPWCTANWLHGVEQVTSINCCERQKHLLHRAALRDGISDINPFTADPFSWQCRYWSASRAWAPLRCVGLCTYKVPSRATYCNLKKQKTLQKKKTFPYAIFCVYILHEIIAVPDGTCIYGPYMNTVFKPNVPSWSDLRKKHSSRSEKARFWSQFSCSLCMLCRVLILSAPGSLTSTAPGI